MDLPGGPLEKQGLRELEQNQPAQDLSIPSTTIRSHQVPLVDGRIRGRLFGVDSEDGHPILVENVSIYVLRNDRVVYTGRVIRGEFTADLVDGEGDYSIVAHRGKRVRCLEFLCAGGRGRSGSDANDA